MEVKRLLPDVRFLGSTLAIAVGFLYFAGSVSRLQDGGTAAGLVAGPMIVLGALAYRSRKRRLLGLRKTTAIRRVLEVLALACILAAWLLQNDITLLIATDPVPNLVIPLWAIVAYFCAGLRGLNAGDPAH